MNDEFRKHALSYGVVGKKWLKDIPEIIRRCEKIWSLKVLPPYSQTYSYVAPVTLQDNSKAVIKIGIPQDKEFQSEIEALNVFYGKGSVKLIREDKKYGAIMIEQVIPGIPLSTIEDDESATRILANVMKKLWKSLPKNHKFITISELTKALYEYTKKFKNPYPIPLYLVDKASKLFKELIATSENPVLTHG